MFHEPLYLAMMRWPDHLTDKHFKQLSPNRPATFASSLTVNVELHVPACVTLSLCCFCSVVILLHRIWYCFQLLLFQSSSQKWTRLHTLQLKMLLDLRPCSKGSYELGSVHPSVLLSGSFFGIHSLVFSKTQHGVRGPCVVHDRVRFFEKNLFAQKMGKMGQKWAKTRVFKIYWKI